MRIPVLARYSSTKPGCGALSHELLLGWTNIGKWTAHYYLTKIAIHIGVSAFCFDPINSRANDIVVGWLCARVGSRFIQYYIPERTSHIVSCGSYRR